MEENDAPRAFQNCEVAPSAVNHHHEENLYNTKYGPVITFRSLNVGTASFRGGMDER